MSVGPTDVAALVRARSNCIRLILLVQEQVANPTQANVDAIVRAATNDVLVPKPDYGLDGESYQWAGYAESLQRQVEQLTKLINMLSAPWEVRSYGC